MFKFIGFRATLDFIKRKQYVSECELSSVSINGAYRSNREDSKDNTTYGTTYSTPKPIVPSMVQLPSSQAKPLKASKSTGDLTKPTSSTQNVSRSSHDLSLNANNISKLQIKQQKKIEKQRQLEQKKQEKIAAQQRDREEKRASQERKRQEQVAAQVKKRREQYAAHERRILEISSKERPKQDNTSHNPATANILRSKKSNAPRPPQLNQELVNQPPSRAAPTDRPHPTKLNKPIKANTIRAPQTTYSTDTLESSVSRSSGPPPYGEFPEIEVAPSNVTFGAPVGGSSWDLISQHREQMDRNTTTLAAPERKRALQYSVGNLRLNSEA